VLKRGLALVAGLLAAALALYALLGRRTAPVPEDDIDDASRAALEQVLRQEDP
jgi:hypothetical protein